MESISYSNMGKVCFADATDDDKVDVGSGAGGVDLQKYGVVAEGVGDQSGWLTNHFSFGCGVCGDLPWVSQFSWWSWWSIVGPV